GRNAFHLHGRVGYDQGPQVPDPRAPEYADDVEAHFDWWRVVWKMQAERGFETITMTPEFGTDGYLHLEPWTQEPVADLWEINCWIAERLREEFWKLG
ncbi:MAG: sugar phosphate isomerase/epimerase, partial [Verrucomicrobiota bacterium]